MRSSSENGYRHHSQRVSPLQFFIIAVGDDERLQDQIILKADSPPVRDPVIVIYRPGGQGQPPGLAVDNALGNMGVADPAGKPVAALNTVVLNRSMVVMQVRFPLSHQLA